MELAKGDSRERMLLLGLASNPNHELHDLRRKGKIVFQKTLGRCLSGTNRGKAFVHHFLTVLILNTINGSSVLFVHPVVKTFLKKSPVPFFFFLLCMFVEYGLCTEGFTLHFRNT